MKTFMLLEVVAVEEVVVWLADSCGRLVDLDSFTSMGVNLVVLVEAEVVVAVSAQETSCSSPYICLSSSAILELCASMS